MGFFFHSRHVNVLLCGLNGAGKTAITLKLNGLDPAIFPPKPTRGFNSVEAKVKGVKHIKWIFWDVCGQQQFQRLWKTYYSNVICFAFVIDATDKERLSDAKTALIELVNDAKGLHFPVLIWANKGHVDGLESLLNDKVTLIECDAFKGDGLKDGLEWLKHMTKKHK
ncbi:ADP-ribosylation factor, arf, putative [Entamoeba invadens IP1]|uniref:ADP-ribosylation factor, arf, putative n=1 Tax=Entamoeba invadens IP1 TaxID=370355 RepID=UPI0002C3DA06|nr:ADP-ribosylation factor, arf, putative [Entamoeba invadens IP1]ELP93093.1 ADP-ribosylation factor, arf, putative [Entamoeba invadens IP1]|eukprot:XP_004259864.1 ADP-ribosylation factor, arf, putative [Entamoeba invadens IP1]